MVPGAEILIKCLEKEGVEVIFGYPGGAALDIFDALQESNKINNILVRHEQGAAHAASGYARAKGVVGVCLATSGPGATNLVTGIATAYMDSIPIVAITGQVASGMVGTDAFQEVDITGITDPITKHNYLVKDAGDIPRIVKEAFYIAKSGRPGPVLIDIPKNICSSKTRYREVSELELRGYKPNLTGHNGQVKQVSRLIQKAKRPLICAGGGVLSAEASEEVFKLAEKLQIPVANTLMGIGSFPIDHPLSLGMLGTYGLASANFAVHACDVLIALGMRFDDRVTSCTEKFAPNACIIHIDIDAAEVGKNVRADYPLVGDLKIVINQINERIEEKQNPEWLEEIRDIKNQYPKSIKRVESEVINTEEVMEYLNEYLPADSIVTTDVGQHQIWAAQLLEFKKPRSFISSGGLGTMGYGIPAAVGAQVSCPADTVVAITGDGSFQMGMCELGTALEQDLPLKVLILNNQCLGMVKQLQDHYCDGRHVSVHFQKNPDFQHLARAYGALTLRVAEKEELAQKVKEFVEHPGLAVLEVIISSKENVYPMVLTGSGINEMVGLG